MDKQGKNPGMELDDAALEGVSGGSADEYLEIARTFCTDCTYNKDGRCRGAELLAIYMDVHHTDASSLKRCPILEKIER